jgi:RNA polymerase primary sigma factor
MEKMRKVLAVKAALFQENGQEPALPEIAARCGLPEEKAAELLELVPQVCSLDTPTGSDGEDTLQIILENIQAPQPQEELVRRELKHTLEQLLGMLTDRQQQILRLHFGMEDGTCHSLQDIADMLGISKERTRQVERQAMDKLQKLGASLGLEEFLE